MVKLKNLKLKGFRSFLDESEVSFPESGMVLLSGKDLRTGGSSGSGKSSIFEAVAYALGINKLPATELKNYNSATMSVELSLLNGSEEWVIKRTSSTLSLSIEGQEIGGMKAELQGRIDSLLSNPDVFDSLSYRRQEDRGKFFNTEDSKLKSFFSQCIPELEKAESVSETAQRKANEIELLITTEKGKVNLLEQQLLGFGSSDIDLESIKAQIESKKLNIQTLSKQLDEVLMTPKPSEVDELLRQKSEMEARLNIKSQEELSEVEPIFEQIKVLEEKKKVSDITLKSFDEQIQGVRVSMNSVAQDQSTVNRLLNDLQGLIEQNKKFLIEINTLKENKCPTCVRTWDEAASKQSEISAKVLGNKELMLKIKGDIESKGDLNASYKNFESQVAALTTQKQAFMMELGAITAEKNGLEQKINNISNTYRSKIQEKIREIHTKADHLLTEHNTALYHKRSTISNSIESEKRLIFSLEDQLRLVTSSINQKQHTERLISDSQTKIKDLEAQFQIESSVAKVLGRQGILGFFFEEMLKEIEEESNRFISEIPNVSDIAISISSSGETKTGTVKTKISTSIMKSGSNISYKSLSGGQKASLSLCVDMAMINAIKRRSNLKLGWLALDEAMDGLDNISKEAAIQVIKTSVDGGLILVIDHSTEIKESFDSVVEVQYDGRTSSVV